MQTQKPTYHPISMLPIVAHAINGSFENTSELIITFKRQEEKPYTLYDSELERALKSFQTGLELVPNFKAQLQQWEKTPLTEEQRKEVNELTITANRLTKTYNDGIALVHRLSPFTIDKKMGKRNDSINEAEHKIKAIEELEQCEDYLVISIASENKKGYRDTNLHISSITVLEEAFKNLARDNPRFRDMLVDVVFSLDSSSYDN